LNCGWGSRPHPSWIVWSPARPSRASLALGPAAKGLAGGRVRPRYGSQRLGVAGSGGGGEGEGGVSGVEPAHAGESPRPDHEGGVLVGLVVVVGPCRRLAGAVVVRRLVVAAGVVPSDLAKPAEGGGVAV
jgi:hypothetical protein